MKSNTQFTFGSDPELFLFDREQNKIVSAIPVLKHDKYDPIQLGDGIKCYSDNVLVEASFPPSGTKAGIVSQMREVFKRLQHSIGPRYSLVPQASHVFGEDEIGPKPASMVGDLPVEWEIGCNPSFNVYTRSQSIPAPFTSGLRTGSFHIHLGNAGWEEESRSPKLLTMESKEHAIRLMDRFVGCASVLFDRDPSAPIRRTLYGKAGEFRPTKYGCEYRPLGNFALRSPACTELVFDLVDHVISIIRDDREVEVIGLAPDDMVQAAINQSRIELAADILVKCRLPDDLSERVCENYDADFSASWGLA